MAFVIADRVRETTTTTGTGSVTLAGAYTSFQTFSAAIGNANNTYYTIASAVNGEWEVGIGTYSSGGNLLSRDTVLSSSNAGSLVNFSVGTKDVFVTQPSKRSLLLQSGGTGLFAGAAAFTSGGVVYANATTTATTSSNLTFDGTTLTANALTTTSTVTINGGTANGVAYLNGSKVLTTGSALTYNGTTLTADTASTSAANFRIENGSFNRVGAFQLTSAGVQFDAFDQNSTSAQRSFMWLSGGSEQMRLTSTGLGIGTSSPSYKLDVQTSAGRFQVQNYGAGSVLLYSNGVLAYNAATTRHEWQVAGSTLMQLESSGNLGLGVTPSAWSTLKAMQFPVGSIAAYDGGASNRQINLINNAYYDGANYRYVATDTAQRYTLINNQHQWYNAPSGTAGNAITFTQAMTLDASGRLGIGETSPSQKLTVGATADASNFIRVQTSTVVGVFGGDSGGGYVGTDNAYALRLFTNNTERARITSGGDLLVGVTSISGNIYGSNTGRLFASSSSAGFAAGFRNSSASGTIYGIGIQYTGQSPNGTGNEFLLCEDSGPTLRASIRSNGGLANYSANDVNLSDRREKTNFAPAKSYLNTICAIPVQTFNYIDQSENDPGLTLGVVAQDVQAVAPELVMESNWGTEDNPKMRLSIYQTDLQYALMKALQELKAEFDAYKATHP